MESSNTLHEELGIIAVVAADEVLLQAVEGIKKNYSVMQFENGIDLNTKWLKLKFNIVAIISRSEIIGTSGISMYQALQSKKFPDVPFFIHTDNLNDNLRTVALKAGIADVFLKKTSKQSIQTRLDFVISNWTALKKNF